MTALLTRLRAARDAGDDSGLTLIEMVVAITVLSVAMILFTGGMIQIYTNLNKTESLSGVQAQLNEAFLRLDKEIRYASSIGAPDAEAPDYYIRYLITNTGSPTCVELKLDGTAKKLLRRNWTHTTGTPAVTAWLPLATNVTATTPFVVNDAMGPRLTPQLVVRVRAANGAAGDATSRATEVTFTALNATGGVADSTLCSEGDAIP
jgi:prepilin-type N-terminal cleavage/methylation domain-containing protein